MKDHEDEKENLVNKNQKLPKAREAIKVSVVCMHSSVL
jgi:hypothetical protein